MRKLLLLLGITILWSCTNDEGSLGATVGDCDENCTVYNVPKNILMQQHDLHDSNFPRKELRDRHVHKWSDGYSVSSWFHTTNANQDTILVGFHCYVYYDPDKIEYVANKLIIQNQFDKQTNSFLSLTGSSN